MENVTGQQNIEQNIDVSKFTGHNVTLPIFSGPLDLLLFLIRRDRMNIHDIPISQIADEFIQYLNMCEELNVEIAAEFLVMASTLLEIKSRMLLPKPPKEIDDTDEEQEDPRAELVKKLLEYQQYKQAAERLRELEQDEKLRFHRPDITQTIDIEKPDPLLYGDPNVLTLWQALQEILSRAERKAEEIEGREIKRPKITIRQQMLYILKLLDEAEGKKISFLSIFTDEDDTARTMRYKTDIIVTFLALLELMRVARVKIKQTEVFGDIFIIARD